MDRSWGEKEKDQEQLVCDLSNQINGYTILLTYGKLRKKQISRKNQ
jgi:hypothetical protein